MDLIYAAVALVFFLASSGLIKLCETLAKDGPGGRS